MVKTRTNLKGTRVSGKATRKISASSNGSPSGGSAKKYNGINSYCPREIPPWQKEITNFFHPKHPGETSKFSNEEQTASSSVNSAH